MTATRQAWVDQVRWVAIVLVVVGHLVGPVRGDVGLAKTISDLVYLFHIPALVLLAGWAGQRMVADGRTLTKTFWQLVVPFAIFQVIAFVLMASLEGWTIRWTFVDQTFGLWFLVALTGWRLLAPWFRGLRYPVLVATAIALGVGLEEKVGAFLSLSRILVFLPLFLAGPALVDAVARWRQHRWSPVAGAGILMVGVVVVQLLQPGFDRSLFFGRDSYEALEMGALEGMAARLLTLTVSTVLAVGLMLVIPGGAGSTSAVGRWTAEAGRHTMYPYLLHLPLLVVLGWSGLLPESPTVVTVLLLVGLGVVLSVVTVLSPIRWVAGPLVEPRAWWDRVRAVRPGASPPPS